MSLGGEGERLGRGRFMATLSLGVAQRVEDGAGLVLGEGRLQDADWDHPDQGGQTGACG